MAPLASLYRERTAALGRAGTIALARDVAIGDSMEELERAVLPSFLAVYTNLWATGARWPDNDEIATRLDTSRQIVSKWRHRFYRQRLAGLEHEARVGRRFAPRAQDTSS